MKFIYVLHHRLVRWFFPRHSMLRAIRLALKNNDPYCALDDVETALTGRLTYSRKMRALVGPLWDILYSDRSPEFKVYIMLLLVKKFAKCEQPVLV